MDQDQNKNDAPQNPKTDPRSTVYKESSTGTTPDNYEDSQHISSTQCEICGAAIPPTRSHCKTHSKKNLNEDSALEWSISHIAFAVVPAVSDFHSIALGEAAFKCRSEAVGDGSSYDLLYDFDDLSKTLTSSWNVDLPETVKVDSEQGKEILQQATNKSDSNEPLDSEKLLGIEEPVLNSKSKSYIYNKFGESLNIENLDEYLDGLSNEEENYWVVPALLYDRTKNTINKTIRNRECDDCGVHQHVFEGYDGGHPTLFENGEAKWTCLNCNKTTTAGAPRGQTPEKPWEDENYAGGDIEEPE
jgi:predicted nucleic acid-binding Zn ribbon protein